VVDYQPGQYLGLRLTVDGQEVRRNYSLSQKSDGRTLRISVKREQGGAVSNHLHDHVQAGDVLDVFPPAGEFVLAGGEAPLALISGGIGITPTLPMAQVALEAGNRDVIFIHYARNGDVHAFGDVIDGWARDYPRFSAHIVYEQGGVENAPSGRPSVAQLQAWVPVEADAYFLGPKPFMGFVNRALAGMGLPESRRHYEFFGPAEALEA